MHGALLSGLREAGRIAHVLLGGECYWPTKDDYERDWTITLADADEWQKHSAKSKKSE